MSIVGVLGFIITAGLTFNFFFSSKEDFFDCVKYYLTPDIWSILKGQFHQDFFAEAKIFFWLILSLGMGFCVHKFFN